MDPARCPLTHSETRVSSEICVLCRGQRLSSVYPHRIISARPFPRPCHPGSQQDAQRRVGSIGRRQPHTLTILFILVLSFAYSLASSKRIPQLSNVPIYSSLQSYLGLPLIYLNICSALHGLWTCFEPTQYSGFGYKQCLNIVHTLF